MARVIVDKALYRDGRRESCGDLSDELDELGSIVDGLRWITTEPVSDCVRTDGVRGTSNSPTGLPGC